MSKDFLLAYLESWIEGVIGPNSMPKICAIAMSRVPSYFCIMASVLLFLVCFLRDLKITVASFILSYFFAVLLVLLTILSIVIPVMSVQNSLR